MTSKALAILAHLHTLVGATPIRPAQKPHVVGQVSELTANFSDHSTLTGREIHVVHRTSAHTVHGLSV